MNKSFLGPTWECVFKLREKNIELCDFEGLT